ncbi:MAG: HEAT repeat domain-containing protein [Candidatus Omnitrophica bacterium]|nr:HEAT repeat domain-containing protein [Candidatus Omnitrophota bacterium]
MFKNLFKSPDVKEIKKSGNEKQLIKLLGHKDANLRAEAAKTLGQIQSQSAIPYLKQMLAAPEDNVRRSVVEALSASNWQPATPEENVVWRLACNQREEFSKFKNSDIPLLFESLQFKGLQINAVVAFGYVWDENILKLLPQLLCADDPQLHEAIEQTLVKIGGPALEQLKEMLKQGRETFVENYCREKRAEFMSGGQLKLMTPDTTWMMMANQIFSHSKRIIYLIENGSWPDNFILIEDNKLAAGIGKVTKDGTYNILIEAETNVPCEGKYTHTMNPGQNSIEFQLLQGDAFVARNNWEIGRFKVTRFQSDLEEKTETEISLTVTAEDKILLKAKDVKTNRQLEISQDY